MNFLPKSVLINITFLSQRNVMISGTDTMAIVRQNVTPYKHRTKNTVTDDSLSPYSPARSFIVYFKLRNESDVS